MTNKDATELDLKIEKLALAIVEEASQDSTSLEDKCEAFRVVTGYYVGSRKLKHRNSADATDAVTLDSLKASVEEFEQ